MTDLLALVLSWLALRTSIRPPTKWATFGFHRVETLAALLNNLTLTGISFYILYTAYLRLINQEPIETTCMIWLSLIGIAASAVIVVLVNDGAKNNLNMRSVWLHFAGEAVASIGVLIGGIIIQYTKCYWVDTALSAMLGLAILRGSVTMLWEIVIILLEGTPKHISIDSIAEVITELPYVKTTEDIHVWCLTEEKIALSDHVRLKQDIHLSQTEPILLEIIRMLNEKFNICHGQYSV